MQSFYFYIGFAPMQSLFKTNWKADRTAEKGKFNAQYFG